MSIVVQAELVNGGDPAQNPRGFRRCLSQFATGVTVITADASGRLIGVTANSFSSVSLSPPLILWSLRRGSRSFESFRAAERFAVNVLASNQVKLAQRFSSAGNDKYRGVDWSPGSHGAPLIHGAVAQFECLRKYEYDGGDHLIFVGDVQHYSFVDAEPLLFVQGRYGVARDHPDLSDHSRQSGTMRRSGVSPTRTSFLSLMFQAYQMTSSGFEAHRAAEGLSRSQVRVLTGLSESPGLNRRVLARTKYLSERDADDAVSFLSERGYIRVDPQGALHLTELGHSRLEVINARWMQFEAEQLRDIPGNEVELARAFFERLIQRYDRSGAAGSE
jgi:4-hydroxyphenylacetate 3-hydroxylase, reductase component